MKFATIGSYLLDDIVVYGKKVLNKEYSNVGRYTCISPISLCYDQSIDEAVFEDHKRSCSNEYQRKMHYSDLKNTVFAEISAKSPDYILFDFTEILSSVVVETDYQKTAFTYHGYLGGLNLLPNERLISYPATLSDNGILNYAKSYVEKLINLFGKDKLIMVKTTSCYQYFDKNSKWLLSANLSELLSKNRIINTVYDYIEQNYNIKNISLPELLVNDLSYSPEGEYKLAQVYYEYLCGELSALVEDGKSMSAEQLADKIEDFTDSKLMADIVNQVKVNGIDAGKKLVLIGKSQPLENMLKERFNAKISGRVKYDRTTSDEELYTATEFLHKKSSKYYLIIPHLYRDSRLLEVLLKRHYMLHVKRMAWLHPNYIIKNFIGDYYDVFNNRIESNSNAYSFTLRGNGNTVLAGKLININEGYISITGKDESVAIIENNVTISRSLNIGNSLVNGWCTKITIGSNTSFGGDVYCIAHCCGEINIGKDCMFSTEIRVYSGDGHAIFDLKTGKNINSDPCYREKNKVVIGDHVWIGRGAFLINCKIGNGSIVGARSLVKKTFPNNCIIAGTPAKVIKKDIGWTREINCMDMDDPVFGVPEEYRHLTEIDTDN